MMLYGASIDSNISAEEEAIIKSKLEPEKYLAVKEVFDKTDEPKVEDIFDQKVDRIPDEKKDKPKKETPAVRVPPPPPPPPPKPPKPPEKP